MTAWEDIPFEHLPTFHWAVDAECPLCGWKTSVGGHGTTSAMHEEFSKHYSSVHAQETQRTCPAYVGSVIHTGLRCVLPEGHHPFEWGVFRDGAYVCNNQVYEGDRTSCGRSIDNPIHAPGHMIDQDRFHILLPRQQKGASC